MSLTTSEMTPADIAAVTGNNNRGGGWGGDNDWWILLLFLLGWGGRGFGGFGGGGGCGAQGSCATTADVYSAVDQQTLISKLDQQTYGLADTFTALNNNLNSNFRGMDNALCTLGYQAQQGFSGLGAQLASCCCDIQRDVERNTTQGIMNTNAIQQQISSCCCDLEKTNMQNRFDAQTYNCNTLQAIDKLGDRIIGYMSNKETDDLRSQLFMANLRESQAVQNNYLLGRLLPPPVPAYPVQNPNCCNNPCGWGN